MGHKSGRPKAENPKEVVIRCRVSKDFSNEIEDFCKVHNVTKADVIRMGISTVLKEEVAATTNDRNL